MGLLLLAVSCSKSDETGPSADDDDTMDYFLGKRPSGATTDSKVDLGMIVRDIEELAILNDEAHRVRDALCELRD